MALKLKPYPAYKESGVPWLGAIPKHWQCSPLCRVARIGLSNVDKLSIEGEIPIKLCNYIDVYHRNFITPNIKFMVATALQREINKFELKKNDVLITKDSESWTDIAVPAYVIKDLPGVVCGYHLAQIRSNSDILLGEYLFRALQAEPIAQQFRLAANGVTRYSISRHDIAKGLLTMPSRSEQRAIVAFVARIERHINRLICAKRRLIELVNEQKQAIIHHAVTRGLDRNVRLNPSGIDWLGDVPEHWEIKRIKQIARIVRGKFTHRPRNDPDLYDGTYPFIQTGDVSRAAKFVTKYAQTLNDRGFAISKMFPLGTLAMTIAANIGDVAI